MADLFVPNQEYIDLLIDQANKQKIKGYTQSAEFFQAQSRLLKFEKEMTSQQIIKNTKLAFSH